MREEFEQFNSEHVVGEDSVFPTKNGTPRIVDTVNTKAKQYQECENTYHENRS